MAYNVELEFAVKTDTGLMRSHNEDSVAISPDFGLAILADGMGGYSAGEVASGIATASIKESLEEGLQQFAWGTRGTSARLIPQMMVEAVERANTTILETAHLEPQYSGMGTTVITALFHHDKVVAAHVGDSRLYRMREGILVLMTRDHSRLQEKIDAGLIDLEQARLSPYRNLITRAVGVEHGLEVEVNEHQTKPGDLYLLCSDGLSDMLSTQDIREILNRLGTDLEAACDALIQRANDNGGRDNTSVILVKVQSSSGEADGLFERMLSWVR
jgi:serine/threonine protein phosphatase PrpC